jgi:transposase
MGWFSGKRRQQEQEQEIARLRQDNAQLQSRVAQLEAENARLLSQLSAARKHSGNSSKPPSSDIVKPKGQRRNQKSKRRIGGQPGHPRHERPAFAPEHVDQRIAYRLRACPVDPAHRISPAQGREHQRTIQQVEIVDKPFKVVEHTAYSVWCHDCGCYHQASLPQAIVRAGLFGPRLTSLAVYLKGRIHASYSGIRDFLQDVVNLKVSRGYVAKLLRKASRSRLWAVDRTVTPTASAQQR